LYFCSGAAICCTLWDEYCKKFIQRYNDLPNSEKLVVVITQAKIKPVAGINLYETPSSLIVILIFSNIGFHM